MKRSFIKIVSYLSSFIGIGHINRNETVKSQI